MYIYLRIYLCSTRGIILRASNRGVHFSYLHLCLLWSKLRRFFFWSLRPPQFDVLFVGVYCHRLLGIAQRSAGGL